MAELCRAILPEIRKIEARLDCEETAGRDTSRLRQTLRELRWRIEYTANTAAICANFERLRASAPQPSPAELADPDETVSYGAGSEVWFLKLDASADHLLADDFDDRGRPAVFLDRINDPVRLRHYLDGLLVSRLAEDGIDRRKELNFATAALVRLILWWRPRGYRWDPRLDTVVRQFVAEWQDSVSGFFGAIYLVGGLRFHTVDLSLTFHMARYVEGRIGHWPQLIDTLFSIRDERYPNGWLDERYDMSQQLRCRGLAAAGLAADAGRSTPARQAGARSAARLVFDHRPRPRRQGSGEAGRRNPKRELLLYRRVSGHDRLFRSREALLDGPNILRCGCDSGAAQKPS
jgi:hypothetical protein